MCIHTISRVGSYKNKVQSCYNLNTTYQINPFLQDVTRKIRSCRYVNPNTHRSSSHSSPLMCIESIYTRMHKNILLTVAVSINRFRANLNVLSLWPISATERLNLYTVRYYESYFDPGPRGV